MFLRKLGKRGAEMVEYAIVLACIAAVGVGFYSSNDSKLTGVLDSLFGNVRQVLGLEAEKEESKVAISENAKQWSGLLNDLYGNLMDLNPNKDSSLKNIKIYKANPEDGTCTVEFYYNDHDKEVKEGTTLKYSVGQDDYYIKGDSFFNFNPDGSISSGATNGNAPTRINITKTGTNDCKQYIGYNDSNGGFFLAKDYFANTGSDNWIPKP